MFGNIFNSKKNEPGPAAPVDATASTPTQSANGDSLSALPSQTPPPVATGEEKPDEATDQGAPSDPSSSSVQSAGTQAAAPPTNSAQPVQSGQADLSALSHLDPRTTQSLTHATEETRRIKQQYIEPDQLLLGLLYDEQLYTMLNEMSADVGKISKEIQSAEKMGVYQGQPTLSKTSQEVFDQAYRDAKMRGGNFVSPEDVLIVLFSPNYSTANYLKNHNLKKEVLVEKFSKSTNLNYAKKTILEKYGIDLTEEARAGKLDPIAGRDKEIERIVHILLRRTKNNPIIIGETGVGKTAIVEGLAQKIVAGSVPKDLQEKRIFQLDVASLVAGASHRGEFEERLRGVINEVLGSNNRIILFIDEIHALMGTGEGEGMNAANIIKPHLARGHFQLIGATTTIEYRKNFEKDKAFERRFQPVTAEEPSEENAFEMLKVIRPKYEKFHHISLPDDALKECVKLSRKYIGERYLPDKAVDLLDEAAAEVKLQIDAGNRGGGDSVVKKADIEKVVSAWTGIPITKLTEDESEKLLKLEDRIHHRLIDQEQAVSAVSEAVRRGRIGLAAANRPIASFVFLGPTGVGKTELAKTLAELLFGKDDAMTRLDMSEYMEKHEVAKLIGAPPGYVGYEEGGQLTEAVRKKPYSIVLLDEIEKAHPDVFNILLQLLEDGRLTDNKGNTISFKNAIIICTSNIGSSTIQQQLSLQDPKAKKTPEEMEKVFKDLTTAVKEELIKFFRPELLNRFDEVVIFKPLQPEHMAGIARLGIAKTAKLLKEQGYNLQITEKAVAQLAKDGYDPVYGARPLRRLIQTAIENPIALAIISKKFVPGDTIVIDYNDNTNEFFFTKSGGVEEAAPLTDEQFKSFLQQLANPDSISNAMDRQRFIEVHDKLSQARSENNKTASAILEVTSTTSISQVQTIRKELDEAKVKGDPLAQEILELASSVAHQIQATLKLKKILLQIIHPETITQVAEKELFMQLHDKVTKESQNNNPLALKILAVNETTTEAAIDQLMDELRTAKEQGDSLAEDILSVVNTEITAEAEAAHEQEPATKFKNVLRQVINPLYLADPVNKTKFSQVYDKISKANRENNSLAASILALTDITSDSDILQLKDQLEKAKEQGDPLATEILDVIAKEIASEPLRKLKKIMLLVADPVAAATPQEREHFADMQTKISDASQKGNQLATSLLGVKESTTDEALQKVLDQLNTANEQEDEIAGRVLEAAGIISGASVSQPAQASVSNEASSSETSQDAIQPQEAAAPTQPTLPASFDQAQPTPQIPTVEPSTPPTTTPPPVPQSVQMTVEEVPTPAASTSPSVAETPASVAPEVSSEATQGGIGITGPVVQTPIQAPVTPPAASAVIDSTNEIDGGTGATMQAANAYNYAGIPMSSRPINYIAPQTNQEEME